MVCAGSFVHLMLALGLFLIVLCGLGVQDVSTTVEALPHAKNAPPTPAQVAGLRPGDKIEAIGGVATATWDDVRLQIAASKGRLTPFELQVPGDPSSAAFLIGVAILAEGGELHLAGVGINPTRIGVLNILERMGATLALRNRRDAGGEPVADIHVRGGRLHGIVIPTDQVPLAIDEFPALFALRESLLIDFL